ncbi:hypothetical protein CAAN1_07S07052 [[Candida] anglica]|uniref:Reverse transcriptase domain-containing protein n=1 Tax=[Candida] anglica TaxID=148631 RepID=A0ABP0EBM3_9ASCO
MGLILLIRYKISIALQECKKETNYKILLIFKIDVASCFYLRDYEDLVKLIDTCMHGSKRPETKC